jgi:hypothetical protein
MGRQVANTGAWGFLHQSVIANKESLGPNLFDSEFDTLTPEQADAIWNDPDYGLKDPNNFIRWDPLIYGRDPVLLVSLNNELKMRFNLSRELINKCQVNWNSQFKESLEFITDVIPETHCDPA